MTSGKTVALTRQTFVGKVTSLLLNVLSRLVITFFPRSKHLLISWLQSPSAVILEPPKIKFLTVSTGEGNGSPLQYSCLENPVDRGAWQVTHSSWGLKESDATERQNTPTHTVSIVSPSVCHEVMGPDAMILSFLNVEF